MRRDYLIAIILAVAGIPAGVTLMGAPDYLHLTGVAVPLTFWSGIGLTVALILAAAAIAWRGRAEQAKSPAISPLSNLPRDIALLDAIWRIFMGAWGERRKVWDGDDPNNCPDFTKFYLICDDIRQKAFDGTLPIWAPRAISQLFEPLPLEFWINRRLLPNIMMSPDWNETWVVFTHALVV